MARSVRQIGELVLLILRRDQGKWGLAGFVVVVLLQLLGLYVNIQLVNWYAYFYDALQQVNAAAILRQMAMFFVWVGIYSLLRLVAEYLKDVVELRWRRILTYELLSQWLGNYTYWQMSHLPLEQQIDNPDQRIADDCKQFLAQLLEQSLGFINKTVTVCSFLVILWNLSTFPLQFLVWGIGVEIPRYMVWSALIYVVVSSFCTHQLGRPLKHLVYEQQQREADFRFALVQIRRNAEEIALLQGDSAEYGIIRRRFERIAGNWRSLIKREFVMRCFTYPYTHSIMRIPLFIALPAYLAGQVSLGGLMKISQVFANVVTALSWFILYYRRLADLIAAASRLQRFLAAAATTSRQPLGFALESATANFVRVTDLALKSPNGQPLCRFSGLQLTGGCSVWLQGVSGLGKTTLIKAVAGLWPYGEGIIERPTAPYRLAFVPQRPYFPLSTFKGAICYPQSADEFSDQAVAVALQAVGMERAISRLNQSEVMDPRHAGFSGGEQQRLALARLILLQPDWAFLYESTSALDEQAEQIVFSRLKQFLPQTTLVVIAHRAPQGLGKCLNIVLEPAG